MKKRLLWTLVFTFLLMLLCGAALAEPWAGSGTEADPWRIRTAADLVALRERIDIGNSYWGNHFLLEKDINLDDYCGQDKGNWVPIGKYSGIRLNGTFDGGGHKITGLFIDSNSNYQGLFASTWSESTIKNLTVEGYVKGADSVGGIAGHSASVIDNCCFRGTVIGSVRAGGICGEGGNIITNCTNYGTVSANNFAGGITGHIWAWNITENCTNFGNVTVDNENVGGIVGWAEKPISGCENHGKIQGIRYVGGIVGDTTTTISLCSSDGQVVGQEHTGHLVGHGTSGAVVTLKPNGGTGSETSEMVYSAPACPFTNGSYTFFAWNTASNGSGTYYFEGDGVPNDNEMTLYAIWMKRRTAAFRTLGDGWWNEQMFVLHGGIAALPGGWYVVGEDTTLSQRLMLSGDVNLVLKDVTTLNASKGINVPEGCSLTIWAQGQTVLGVLNATGAADCAGIGGGKGQSGGTITINGGIINATGGNYGAGIGGGDTGAGGTVIVNRGTVTARGKEGAAGIGGGDYGRGGTFTINGGTVTATGSKRSNTGQASPGIGAGRPRTDGSSPLFGGTVNFYGGTTVARSGGTDAGIGAYAVGLNYADYNSTPEQYGNFSNGLTMNFGTGMAATPAGAGEPALFHQRNQALMSGEVTVAPCRHPGQGATSQCAYCQGNTRFDTYLYHAASGYLIQDADDWDTFVWLVNEAGLPTTGLTFQLEADISVSAMVGTSANPFGGTFNGNGKTMTVNLTASSSGKGPFAYASDAAFMHLHVAGAISTNVSDTGGLIGYAAGSCTITDCVSDVDITVNGDNGHAGFVGSMSGNVSIVGSVYTGSIVGTGASYCAGFAGSGGGTVDDSVYDGLISGKANNSTFLRMRDRAENCYYTNIDGIDRIKGMQAVAVTPDEGVTVGFGATKTTYPASGITTYAIDDTADPVGLMYGGVFFAGPGQTVTLNLDAAAPEGMLVSGFTASTGTLTRNGGAWTLTLADTEAIISASYAPAFGTPDFILPAGLTEVEEGAFEGIAASVVEVPEDCVSIGAGAFRNCPNLTQIRIPADCSIGTDAFDGCTLVYIYSAPGSGAETYCDDPTHDNCVFVAE